MAKNKNKQTPAQRREQEKLRRMAAPAEKARKKAEADAAAEAARARAALSPAPAPMEDGARDMPAVQEAPALPETPEKPAPEPAPPEEAPVMAPAARRPAASRYAKLDFEDAGDAGADCRNYVVHVPPRFCLPDLFDAIRKERRDDTGTVFVSTNLAEAGPGNYKLSYDYAGGLFTRREDVSKNKKAPALADLLDRPILRARASGGWGRMDYFVNIAAPGSGQGGGT